MALARSWPPLEPVPAQPLASIVIQNATLIDGTGSAPRRGASLVIIGDRIAAISFDRRDHVPAVTTVDATGRFAIPGLWDLHTHLAYAGDITPPVLVAYGVTSVRDLGGGLETVDWLRERIQRKALIGPRIFRAGPLVDGSKPKAQDRLVVETADDGRAAVQFRRARGVDFVKVHTGAPRPAYLPLLTEARRHGLHVVGHLAHSVRSNSSPAVFCTSLFRVATGS